MRKSTTTGSGDDVFLLGDLIGDGSAASSATGAVKAVAPPLTLLRRQQGL